MENWPLRTASHAENGRGRLGPMGAMVFLSFQSVVRTIAVHTMMICLAGLTTELWAEQFKLALGRGESLKVRLVGVPQVRIGTGSLAIEVKDATALSNTLTPATGDPGQPVMPAPVTQLQAALDQQFGGQFTLVQSNGAALLRVAITHFTAPQSQIVVVKQKVRVAAAPNADGTPAIDPQTGQPATYVREVDVEQWQGRGQISLRTELVDPSGVLLDGFSTQTQVNSNAIVSMDGQDRVDRTQIPTREQILDKLVRDVAVQFGPRYAPAPTEEELPLAVDEELRAGNKLAKEGNWAAAAEAWKTVQLRKSEAAGDRVHNLGTVYEAQAYDLLLKQEAPAKVMAYLQQAAQQYQEAKQLDPKEKYIAQAGARVQKAMGMVARLEELEGKRQSVLAAKAQPSPWPPGTMGGGMGGAVAVAGAGVMPGGGGVVPSGSVTPGAGVMANDPTGLAGPPNGASPTSVGGPATAMPVGGGVPVGVGVAVGGGVAVADPVAEEALQAALDDPRADSEKENQFRQMVRLRLAAGSKAPSAEVRQQLEGLGAQAYGLTALQARRVVHQEAKAFHPNRLAYREAFAAFALDGSISTEERKALATLAQNLQLQAAEVQAIEAAVPQRSVAKEP